MSGFGALYRKELASVFHPPIATAIAAVFMLLLGYTYCAQLFHTASPSLVAHRYQIVVLLLLTVPLITMRQIAEERTSGTFELLLSAPVSDDAVIAAKFAAASSFVALLLVLTLIFPLSLAFLTPVDWGAVAASLTGLALLSLALVALGLALSAVSPNQAIAGAAGIGLFLLLWTVESLAIFLPPGWGDVALDLSLDARLAPFVTGVVYLSDVGYFVTLTLLGLFVARSAIARR